MRKFGILVFCAFLTLACRQESDFICSYGQDDTLSFKAAKDSFSGQFKALWTALNCNYGIWDYEQQSGLDWDAVYTEYLPRMEALDTRDKKTDPVTDDELKLLYTEILSPLHDGHLSVRITNLHTGNEISISPSRIRNASREDFDWTDRPDIYYYLTPEAGVNQADAFQAVSVRPYGYMMDQLADAISDLERKIGVLEAKPARTDLDDYYLARYREARDAYSSYELASMEDISYFNNVLASQYAHLGYSLIPFDVESNYWIDLRTALFDQSIAYIYFTNFKLTPYLTGQIGGTSCQDEFVQRFQKVYWDWYSTIQDLHLNGKLKGVIIDVRGNGGGYANDYQYILGSLLPSGGHQIGKSRQKMGVGRLDFSPLTPNILPTFAADHATITEPVVVLANCNSVSMAEVTCLGAKAMDNAIVMGTPTWGGLCMLNTDPADYSFHYAGSAGIEGKTSFYAYIPNNVTVSDEFGILEGVGVTPDITVPLDRELFSTTGRDSQLERALLYIRTGK